MSEFRLRDTKGVYIIDTCRTLFNRGTHDKPLWYETLIFNKETRTDVDVQRYETEQEAEEGHNMLMNDQDP